MNGARAKIESIEQHVHPNHQRNQAEPNRSIAVSLIRSQREFSRASPALVRIRPQFNLSPHQKEPEDCSTIHAHESDQREQHISAADSRRNSSGRPHNP